jgi:hypothetical protein
MRLALVNSSTVVSAADAATLVEALNTYGRDYLAPAWGGAAPSVTLAVPGQQGRLEPDTDVFTLVDAPTAAEPNDAMAYHDVLGGTAFGRIFCKPSLAHGGTVLRGPDSVAASLSHEYAEWFQDRWTNFWAVDRAGILYALELCDAVEDTGFDVNTRRGPVTVSNFVLPAWFNPSANHGPYDYMKLLSAPFTKTAGGYVISGRAPESVRASFGDGMPEWKRHLKLQHSRRLRERAPGPPPSWLSRATGWIYRNNASRLPIPKK